MTLPKCVHSLIFTRVQEKQKFRFPLMHSHIRIRHSHISIFICSQRRLWLSPTNAMTLAKCISVQLASSRELTQIGNVFSPQSVMISEFICRIALELYFDILLIFHNGKFSLKRSLGKKGEKYIKDQGKQVVNPRPRRQNVWFRKTMFWLQSYLAAKYSLAKCLSWGCDV